VVAPGTLITKQIRLLEPLAEGAMGKVWKAEHLVLSCLVAVKFIHADLVKEIPELTERFEREAKAVAQIKSPHVVQILDYGISEATGVPYIAMELLHGYNLTQWLERAHRLGLRDTLRLVTQTCSALQKAHRAGIIHRDIKPENLFLIADEEDLFVKLLDFGVAKHTQVNKRLTARGILVGTPHYMSPEQCRSAADIDHRSDLWAVAVVAYEALTGKMPFDGTSLPEVIASIATGAFRPATELLPKGAPPALDDWFRRAFARDLDARFQSARDLSQALRRVLGEDSEPGFDSRDSDAPRDSVPPSRGSMPDSEPPPRDSVPPAAPELDGDRRFQAMLRRPPTDSRYSEVAAGAEAPSEPGVRPTRAQRATKKLGTDRASSGPLASKPAAQSPRPSGSGPPADSVPPPPDSPSFGRAPPPAPSSGRGLDRPARDAAPADIALVEHGTGYRAVSATPRVRRRIPSIDDTTPAFGDEEDHRVTTPRERPSTPPPSGEPQPGAAATPGFRPGKGIFAVARESARPRDSQPPPERRDDPFALDLDFDEASPSPSARPSTPKQAPGGRPITPNDSPPGRSSAPKQSPAGRPSMPNDPPSARPSTPKQSPKQSPAGRPSMPNEPPSARPSTPTEAPAALAPDAASSQPSAAFATPSPVSRSDEHARPRLGLPRAARADDPPPVDSTPATVAQRVPRATVKGFRDLVLATAWCGVTNAAMPLVDPVRRAASLASLGRNGVFFVCGTVAALGLIAAAYVLERGLRLSRILWVTSVGSVAVAIAHGMCAAMATGSAVNQAALAELIGHLGGALVSVGLAGYGSWRARSELEAGAAADRRYAVVLAVLSVAAAASAVRALVGVAQ
jgi:serine/threonine-protein kinase